MTTKKLNYKEHYEKGAGILRDAGVPEYELDARLLLEFVCGTDHNTLLVHGDTELSPEQEKKYGELIQERSRRRPLAYLTGVQEFMGLEFSVTDDVLVPNQDTETLVEEALTEICDGMRFLDLCTGSGCVALSLLHYTNDTQAVMTDISDKALAIADTNAVKLGLEDRCERVLTDLFPPAQDNVKFDMIVSNPPYIKTDVIDTLPPEVREGEPHLALDGGGDGLDFYRRIVEIAPRYLRSSGWLMVEIGYDQGEQVSELLEQNDFHEVEVIRDLGGQPRVVKGCFFNRLGQ